MNELLILLITFPLIIILIHFSGIREYWIVSLASFLAGYFLFSLSKHKVKE